MTRQKIKPGFRIRSRGTGLFRVFLGLLPVILLSGCYWGEFRVSIIQRTSGTVSFDIYVPQLLRDFKTADGLLLPFPGSQQDFRDGLAGMQGVTADDITFANTAAGWRVTGNLRYSSIEGFTRIIGFFSGTQVSTAEWQTNSTLTISVEQKDILLHDSPVMNYYRNLFSEHIIAVYFSGAVDMARVQNGTRQEDGTVLFEFSPAQALEAGQSMVIGW